MKYLQNKLLLLHDKREHSLNIILLFSWLNSQFLMFYNLCAYSSEKDGDITRKETESGIIIKCYT